MSNYCRELFPAFTGSHSVNDTDATFDSGQLGVLSLLSFPSPQSHLARRKYLNRVFAHRVRMSPPNDAILIHVDTNRPPDDSASTFIWHRVTNQISLSRTHERHLCGRGVILDNMTLISYARLRRFHQRISTLSFFSAADVFPGSLLNLVRRHPEAVIFIFLVLSFVPTYGFISMMAIHPYVVDSDRTGERFRPAIALDAVRMVPIDERPGSCGQPMGSRLDRFQITERIVIPSKNP